MAAGRRGRNPGAPKREMSVDSDSKRAGLGPPLKWAGGKRWLVPHLLPWWRPRAHLRLVEPFCGGLAVALGLRPERALLGDVNPHPINFYRHLQRSFRIGIPMRNERELYYQHRSEFNRLVTGDSLWTGKAASLFYYLNRTGYNGLCRFNRKGEFNVPFGRHDVIHYRRDFTSYRGPFAAWTFRYGDFESVELEPDDFIYADPPYDVEFRQYSKDGFDWPEQERLARWLCRHRGPVVLSNQATTRIVELYRGLGYRLHFLSAPRNISRTGDRSPAKEVLATRNLPPLS